MDNSNYYEKFNWNKANLSGKLIDKIEKVLNAIPGDVKTILDVGCGDGTISEALNNNFDIIASDRSINALKHVKTKRVCNSADLIALKSNSVDLVFSSEMIEHLPDEIFVKAISEFKRVSKKYVFLTFPNNENIEKLITKCNKCNFVFNKSYHLRSLNEETIRNLFPDYNIISNFNTGTKVRPYNKVLSKIKQKLSPSNSWIPYFWMKKNDSIRDTMCPNCGNSFSIPYRFHPIASMCDFTNILISKKEPYQLCLLLQKK